MAKQAKTVAKDLGIDVARVLELADKPDGTERTLVDPDQISQRLQEAAPRPKPKRQGKWAKAAAVLMELIYKHPWPEGKPFPSDLQKVRIRINDPTGGRPHFREGRRGTTVDGELLTVTLAEYSADLSRNGWGIPVFSQNFASELVTALSKTQNAPQEDATDKAGIRLFINRTAWWWYMVRVAEMIYWGELNPQGLDYEQFPERKGIGEVVWRHRLPHWGLVDHAFNAFVAEAEAAKLRGTDLRRFERQWLEEFTTHQRTFEIGEQVKSMDDFTIGRQVGTPEQFKAVWDVVKDPRARRRS